MLLSSHHAGFGNSARSASSSSSTRGTSPSSFVPETSPEGSSFFLLLLPLELGGRVYTSEFVAVLYPPAAPVING